jgi:hypothetical protein
VHAEIGCPYENRDHDRRLGCRGGANYITWSPVHSSIRLVEADGGAGTVDVLLRNQNPNRKGGQIVFRDVIAGAE